MNIISKDELKERLDRGDEFHLLMALGELAWQAKHIPGSVYTSTPDVLLEMFDKDEDIVVYCTNPNCVASIAVYKYLEGHGYQTLSRYAGGLEEWEDAGFPLEGDMMENQ